MKKADDFRKQTIDQLNAKLAELKVELFNLRFQYVINQLENPMKISVIKKDIARIKTIITQKINSEKGERV
ncbi:MAG: 50S ribosomal protein L29 [Oscillospiraceae bacterium]|nr:50S ribosomal protein L29 [Oscillospiraceae bacterium]